MNDNLKRLMLEAGYASPEIAGRANKLAQLIIRDCVKIIETWAVDDFALNGISIEILDHFDMELDDEVDPIGVDDDWDAEAELQKLVDELDMRDKGNKDE